jgi:hypothetical protein
MSNLRQVGAVSRYLLIGGWPVVRILCQWGAVALGIWLTYSFFESRDQAAHQKGLVKKADAWKRRIWYYIGVSVVASIIGKYIWDQYGPQLEAFLNALFPLGDAFDSTTPAVELFEFAV